MEEDEQERRLRAKGWNDPPAYTFDQINKAQSTVPLHKRYKYPTPAAPNPSAAYSGSGVTVAPNFVGNPGQPASADFHGALQHQQQQSQQQQQYPQQVGSAPIYSQVSVPHSQSQAMYGHQQPAMQPAPVAMGPNPSQNQYVNYEQYPPYNGQQVPFQQYR